jgi:thymidylate synthase (FAD)
MRILYDPKVYLVQKPALVHEGFEEFLKDNDLKWPTPRSWFDEGPDGLIGEEKRVSDAETGIELAGRVCYMSFGSKAGSKTNRAYIDNLLGKQGDGSFRHGPAHGAVTEHENYSFIVTGASRGWSHEQVRHRAGFAYSQLSTRYCDYEQEESGPGDWEPAYVVPPLGQLSEKTKLMFEFAFKEAKDAYTEILHSIEEDLYNNSEFMESLGKKPGKERRRAVRKAARGAAREVLPNATEAIMYMTANARAIWNTIVLRASAEADAVIREVYVQIARIMEQEMPNTFVGLRYEKMWDGSEIVTMPREKL